MTDNQPMTQDEQLTQLDQALGKFESFLKGDGTTTPSLRNNLIYLQIFATYGQRLPHTAASLRGKLTLSESDVASYTWFDALVEAYAALDGASTYFFDDVLNNMSTLGSQLQNFTNDAAGDISTFTAILQLLEPGSDQDLPTALELLSSTKQAADQAATLAATIGGNLTTYKTKLTDVDGKLQSVKKSIDDDDRTSQQTIDKLSGDKKVSGSIAQMNELLRTDWNEYNHDVTLASTTVAYAWVFWPLPPIPVGLLAAVPVAAWYGKKAVDMLGTIHDLEAQLTTAQSELNKALTVQHTTTTAQTSVSKTMQHLEVAIDKVTTIQNAWQGVSGGLDYIMGKVDRTIKHGAQGQDALQALAVVRVYIKHARDKWAAIAPTVEQMTKNPFITVKADQDITTFMQQVNGIVQQGA